MLINTNNQVVDAFLNRMLDWGKELHKGLNYVGLRIKELWESENIHVSLKIIPIVVLSSLTTLIFSGSFTEDHTVSKIDSSQTVNVAPAAVATTTAVAATATAITDDDSIKKHQQELQLLKENLNKKHQQELQLAKDDLNKKHQDALKVLKHQQLLEIMETKLTARAKTKIQRSVAAIPLVGLGFMAYFEKIEYEEWKKDHPNGTVEEYSQEVYTKSQELLDREYADVKKYADQISKDTDFEKKYDDFKKQAGEFGESAKGVMGEYYDKMFK